MPRVLSLVSRRLVSACCGLVLLCGAALPLPAAAELKVGVSDWPGWVAWYVAEQKGLFKKHGAPQEASTYATAAAGSAPKPRAASSHSHSHQETLGEGKAPVRPVEPAPSASASAASSIKAEAAIKA